MSPPLALWYTEPGHAAVLPADMGRGDVVVETLYSAISRGTERLVLTGSIPRSEWARMRAPLQDGDFPFPVKYGYAAVGRVVVGPANLIERQVFVLHPHQTRFCCEERWITPVPDTVPARRATLAANMETALNAIWDADMRPNTPVAVIGAGLVGCLVAYLARHLTRGPVTLVDRIAQRADIARALDVTFALPEALDDHFDVIFHTSATERGLLSALNALRFEGKVIEMSWYGDQPVTIPLGGVFHSKRLQIISSQVGHVAPSRRADTSHRARLEQAMSFLSDPRLDALITQEIRFEDAAERVPQALQKHNPAIATILKYGP